MELNLFEEEWIKCANSFEYFAAHYVYIQHPDRGPIQFKLYDFQKRVIENYENNKLNIISKFRQAGLTTLTVTYMLWRCMFKADESILFMSKTDREAIKAGKVMSKILQHMQNKHPWLHPNMANNTHHEKTFTDTGCSIEFRTVKAARGQAVSWLIIDEAAFIQGMEEAWKDMYPTVATGGRVIVNSTVNGHGNWYAIMYHDALARKNTFNVIDLDYTEHPDYKDPKWVQNTKANMKPREWAQEFERSFLGSGSNYFSDDVIAELDKRTKSTYPIKKLFSEYDDTEATYDTGQGEGEKGAMWVWQPPKEGHEYILAADVAEGKGSDGDNSTFIILDNHSMEQVAEFSSNTASTGNFAVILAQVGQYYNHALLVVENNSLASTVLDRLVYTLYYENLYYHPGNTMEKPGLNISRTTRPMILETVADYLENRSIKINSSRLVQEMLTFRFNRMTKRAEAEKGHHDDLIMALAIAIFVRDRSVRDVPAGANIIEPIGDMHLNSVFDRIKKQLDTITPTDLISYEKKENYLYESNKLNPLYGIDPNPRLTALLREVGLW